MSWANRGSVRKPALSSSMRYYETHFHRLLVLLMTTLVKVAKGRFGNLLLGHNYLDL